MVRHSGFEVGATVSGRVTEVLSFGAHVYLGDGIEGFVHISEMGDGGGEPGGLAKHRNTGDYVVEGQEGSFRVVDGESIDIGRGTVILSLLDVKQPEPVLE